MDVATFLAKADGLKAKGMAALFSSDLKLVKAEMASATKQLQAEKAARDGRACRRAPVRRRAPG